MILPGLEEITRKHLAVFRLRLGADGPADIATMKIRLSSSIRPIKVKVHKYRIKQRKLLDEYISKLDKLGYLH